MTKWILFFSLPLMLFSDLVVTPPKSGTHWFMYSIAALTGIDTFADQRFSAYVDYDLDKAPLRHTHGMTLKQYPPLGHENEKVILLIRDYKECLVRRWGYRHSLVLSKLDPKKNDGQTYGYVETLQRFDKWDPEKRLLLHYEDLILNPRATLKKALDFLGESDEELDDFIRAIESHKENSLAFYASNRTYGRPISKGKDLNYHKKRSPPWFFNELDRIFYQHYPDITEKYLKCYSSTH